VFILPVSRDTYFGRTPVVILAIATLNLLLLALTFLFSSQSVFNRFGFVPAHATLFTAFCSLFLHAGIFHYLGNMFFLWMFGDRIENTFGGLGFVAAYIACGFGATGLHYVLNQESSIPCIGASGAISGIVGCYLVLFPRSEFDLHAYAGWLHLGSSRTTAIGAVGVWIAEQFVLGLVSLSFPASRVAFWAHIGGFATGVLLTSGLVLIAPQIRRRGEQAYIRRRIKGSVLDANGRVLRDAVIELRTDSDKIVKTVYTGVKGQFEIQNVEDGYYLLTVTKLGFGVTQEHVIVRRRTRLQTPMVFRLSRATEAEPADVAFPLSDNKKFS
jgi:membrane associated rhomboid family serine protease